MWQRFQGHSFLLLSCVALVYSYGTGHGRCERITIPMCIDLKYNMTSMPNLVGHSNQNDAGVSVHEFIPLVQYNCSPLLKFFLCSLYAPMCTEQVEETLVIPPCRSMCLSVKERCEPVLKKFNFPWPDILSCDNLPIQSDRRNLCIEPAGDSSDGGQNTPMPGGYIPPLPPGFPMPPSSTTPPEPHCPDRFAYVSDLPQNRSCAPLCNTDVYFRREDKNFAQVAMAFLCVWFWGNQIRPGYPSRVTGRSSFIL